MGGLYVAVDHLATGSLRGCLCGAAHPPVVGRLGGAGAPRTISSMRR